MTCDTIKFFSKEDKILSIGESHVWDKDYDLKADSITIFTKIDSGVAIGNVILIQKGQIIKADRIEYQKEKEKDGISYTSTGNVIIQDSIRIATCGRARYDRKREMTELSIDPKIQDSTNRVLSGEKISLTYYNEELKKIHIPAKASAVTPIKGYRKSMIDSLSYGDTLKFQDSMEGQNYLAFLRMGKLTHCEFMVWHKRFIIFLKTQCIRGKTMHQEIQLL